MNLTHLALIGIICNSYTLSTIVGKVRMGRRAHRQESKARNRGRGHLHGQVVPQGQEGQVVCPQPGTCTSGVKCPTTYPVHISFCQIPCNCLRRVALNLKHTLKTEIYKTRPDF